MYPLNNILFLDIKTVPQHPSFEGVSDEWRELWNQKVAQLNRDKQNETPESIYSRAGIYAEFGKIICISCGILSGTGEDKKLVLKSFGDDNEKSLLQQFHDMLVKWSADGNKYLCAHNGKGFDFPYICRRMIVNDLPIPAILNLSGKKPWEVAHLDTMDLWKFGDYKNYTSLNLLSHTLNIPTPKDDIDGSMVYEVYWHQHDLIRIVNYCQKDVVTVAQVYLRMNREPLLKAANIEVKQHI